MTQYIPIQKKKSTPKFTFLLVSTIPNMIGYPTLVQDVSMVKGDVLMELLQIMQ
jgi:hypothetical protein